MDKLSDYIIVNSVYILKYILSPNNILYYYYYDIDKHKLVCSDTVIGAGKYDNIDDARIDQEKIYRLFKLDFSIERIKSYASTRI